MDEPALPKNDKTAFIKMAQKFGQPQFRLITRLADAGVVLKNQFANFTSISLSVNQPPGFTSRFIEVYPEVF